MSKYRLMLMRVKEEAMNKREEEIILLIKEDKNLPPRTIKYLVSKIMENRQ